MLQTVLLRLRPEQLVLQVCYLNLQFKAIFLYFDEISILLLACRLYLLVEVIEIKGHILYTRVACQGERLVFTPKAKSWKPYTVFYLEDAAGVEVGFFLFFTIDFKIQIALFQIDIKPDFVAALDAFAISLKFLIFVDMTILASQSICILYIIYRTRMIVT